MPRIDSDFKNLYYPLNELLEDMCNFLYNERLDMLSEKDRNMAESIIIRSKKQLKALSKFKPLIQNNEEYVIMNKVPTEDEEDINDTYSSIDENYKYTEVRVSRPPISFTDLPAKDVCKDVKFGHICMKKKCLLGFEIMGRIYAAIHMKCLLIYHSAKDTKPIFVLDLVHHRAREICKKSGYFDVISFDPECKTYHFQAPNRDEMLSWITRINKCRLRKKRRSTGNNPPVSETPLYDVVKPGIRPTQHHLSKSTEVLYEDLSNTTELCNNNVDKMDIVTESIPQLPRRYLIKPKIIPAVSIRTLPLPKCPSDQHLELQKYINIDHRQYESEQNSLTLRLGDDEEATYEEVDDILNRPGPSKDSEDTSNPNRLEATVTPVFPARPRLAEKPPILKKPTYLRTARRVKLV